MRMTLVLVALISSACGATYGGPACKNLVQDLCDACPKNDAQARTCTCLEKGTLTGSDFDGDVSDDEAAKICTRIQAGLDYPGPDSAASCRADLDYLREWDVDACEDLGWTN